MSGRYLTLDEAMNMMNGLDKIYADSDSEWDLDSDSDTDSESDMDTGRPNFLSH